MRTLVVVNPHATTTTPRTRVLLAALHDQLAVDVLVTEHRGHAIEAAREARRGGVDIVVAHGGDGTVNEVVNGLLADGPGPDMPLLGIVPGGRTNVMARNLGIPDDPVEATGALLDAWREGTRTTIGLGTVGERYFTFNAGLGLDAAVVHAVERARAKGKTSTQPLYVRSAFTEYFRSQRKLTPLTMRRPGVPPVSGLQLAIVANCTPWTYLGPIGVSVTPKASFADGLDVVALTTMTAARTLRHAAEITLTKGGARGKDVITGHDLPWVEFVSRRPVPLQVDGDYLGDVTYARFASVPDALTLLA